MHPGGPPTVLPTARPMAVASEPKRGQCRGRRAEMSRQSATAQFPVERLPDRIDAPPQLETAANFRTRAWGGSRLTSGVILRIQHARETSSRCSTSAERFRTASAGLLAWGSVQLQAGRHALVKSRVVGHHDPQVAFLRFDHGGCPGMYRRCGCIDRHLSLYRRCGCLGCQARLAGQCFQGKHRQVNRDPQSVRLRP